MARKDVCLHAPGETPLWGAGAQIVDGRAIDASNTGVQVGVTLLRVPEDATSGTGWTSDGLGYVGIDAGATVTGLDIKGQVTLGNGATMRNCRVRSQGEPDWGVIMGSDCTVEYCEVGGGDSGTLYTTLRGFYSGGPNNVIRRCNMHHSCQGAMADGGTLIEECFVHDQPMGDPVYDFRTGTYSTDRHTDGLMTTRNGGTVIRRCHIIGGNTACIFAQADPSDLTARIGAFAVEYSYLELGAKNGQVPTYGINAEDTRCDGPITYTGNIFTNTGWQAGPYYGPAGITTASGNIYESGSTAD